MILNLVLSKQFSSYKNKDGDDLSSLCPFNKVNLIVGSNNSGKSRFIRRLSLQSFYKIELIGFEWSLPKLNNELICILERIEVAFEGNGIRYIDDSHLDKLIKLKDLPNELFITQDKYLDVKEYFQNGSKFQKSEPYSDQFVTTIRNLSKQGLEILGRISVQYRSPTPKRVYIPTLRGLRPLDKDHTDFYANKTREDYFSEQKESLCPEIFTGLSLYGTLEKFLFGSTAERRKITQYQNFLSKELFEDKEVTLTPHKENNVVTIKIGVETEQPIHHLGDGVQAAIILSFLPFVTQEPTFFFIEEPECHMHPGLQRKVLELFARDSRHNFFLTTHSNHLLDITIDLKETSIFNFQKNLNHDADDDEQLANVIVESVNVGSQSSLEQLGVRNSSVFLVNATIWVEGITDRWYLRALLRSYLNHIEKNSKLTFKPEEDVHYSFVEYGGNNITHWSFLENEDHPIEVDRLCSKAMVILDQDGNSKLDRKEAIKEKLGDRYCIVEGREIENILPPDIIRDVVASYEKQKPENLPKFDFDSYQNKYIGAYIQNALTKVTRKGGYKDKSGTIKGKVAFCKRASVLLQNFDFVELPDSTQKLGKAIYNFILENNKL